MTCGCFFAAVLLLGQGPVADGCFWISVEDFCATFNVVYTCNLLAAADGWFVERRVVRDYPLLSWSR